MAPPDDAPGIEAIVTGYDLVFEAATKLDPSLMPRYPSFAEHIYLLLGRHVAQQWVNDGPLLAVDLPGAERPLYPSFAGGT